MLFPNRALVLLSGGRHSTICLGYALYHYDQVVALTIDSDEENELLANFEESAALRVTAFFERMMARSIKNIIIRCDNGMIDGPLRIPQLIFTAANEATKWGCANVIIGLHGKNNNEKLYVSDYQDLINNYLDLTHTNYAWQFKIRTPLLNKSEEEIARLISELPHTQDALVYAHRG